MSTIKAWLTPNPLTTDPSDYTAQVKMNGNLTVADIIRKMQEDGMEIQPETAVDIISRFFGKAVQCAAEGYCINTGLVNLRPVIRGSFTDQTWNADRNSVRISTSPGTLLRQAARKAQVKIIGPRPSHLSIISVKDLATGRMDGSFTRSRAAELRGTNLKLIGPHPDVGIAFRHIETHVETRLTTGEIVINHPKRLVILIPDTLPAGTYHLVLTTQYTSNKNRLLKTPATLVYNRPILIS